MKRLIHASYDPSDADLYVVKIWYEIEPEYDAPNGPQAAEEIIEVVATSPQEAIEYAKRAWSGPIDRIEIVDINPEREAEDIPFNACNKVNASLDIDEDRDSGEIVYDAEYDYGFLDIEEEVHKDLGLYLDFSSVRGSYGPIFIYDSTGYECNSDMWDGDPDAEITSIDYSEWADDVVTEVLCNPEEEWERLYKEYIQSLI